MAGSHSRYIPALDGLRAFAVLSVIAYHMGFSWAQGGLLGVTVFFVLSGYLITGLLITEYRTEHSINLPNFWLRRVRRLVPAIIFVILGVALLCTLFNHALLTKMRDDIIPSLFFYSNWWQIFHNVSYFQAIGSPSPLQHFWSLAIEEQFYLIWPVLLLTLFKHGVKSKPLRRGILVLALISVVDMALLYSPTADPSRVYYGTDTRAFSLLIGAWLAFTWPSANLTEESGRKLPKQTRALFNVASIAAFVGLVMMVAFANGYSPFLYRGGILLCSLLTAIVIAAMVHPISLLGKAASAPPLVWIGKRSYGMYLWHYPILLLMTDHNTTADPNPLWLLLELGVIFGISAFSYTFIENPIRHGGLEDWVRSVRSGAINLQQYVSEHMVPAIAGGLVVVVALGGIAFVPPEYGVKGIQELREAEAQEENAQVDAITQAPQVKTYSPVLIGDSVSVHIIPIFHNTFPDGLIDSAVNRQMAAGRSLYDQYRDAGCVGDTVIIALGTNGTVTAAEVDALMADIGPDKQVYFVNTRSPQDWMETTNAQLSASTTRYANAHLVDWYGLSAGHDEWFDGDGTHLNDEGSVAYMQMICNAMGYTAYTPSINDFYTDNGQAHVGMENFVGDTLETTVEADGAAQNTTTEDSSGSDSDSSSASDSSTDSSSASDSSATDNSGSTQNTAS